jgi:glycerol-3-phosphate dehydrogenase (NAD(P)+)
MTRAAILGAGAWGTALGHHLASQGHEVVVWARDAELARVLNEQHRNPSYLPGMALHRALRASPDLAEAVRDRDVVVSAVPSQAVRGVLQEAAPAVAPGALVVGASKGIETETLLRMSEVAAAVVPGRPFVALSGPSFATEMLDGQPTAVVAASASAAAASWAQDLFSGGPLRVYTSGDVLGIELAGAFKNVIAIAAGLCEGLGLGSNPRAALITRGLAEIARLGTAMGADRVSFAGLAGMGDLVLTCFGALSRNRALGVALGQGDTLAHYLESHRVVVEGVPTARIALRMARRAGVELPIATQVAECLFEGKSPRQAITELMERPPKPEQWT